MVEIDTDRVRSLPSADDLHRTLADVIDRLRADRAANLIWPSSLLVELLRDLTDPGECSFDHHGYCQEHVWLTDERPCPHGRAKKLLALVDEGAE